MKLPIPFAQSNLALLGDESHKELLDSLQQEPSVSIRLNCTKQPDGAVLVPLTKVPWSTTGRYLEERLTFTFDPLFHAGCYYVQEASSMFIEEALKSYLPAQAVTVLDLCAAPGGKTTHLCSLLSEGSVLVANEVNRKRSQILAENVTKWGYPNVMVTNNDPADFAEAPTIFDVMLVDAPCSGEGMFRKDPNSIEEWSTQNVEICGQRQQRILTDIWPKLRSGGFMIYSTCTFNTQENEETVQWMCDELGAEILELNVPSEWKITGNLLPGSNFPVYRFFPHYTRGEGFFMAVVRKPQSVENVKSDFSLRLHADNSDYLRKKKKKSKTKSVYQILDKHDCLPLIKTWLKAPENYLMAAKEETIIAISRALFIPFSLLLEAGLTIVQVGITMGEVKGKSFTPHQSLAMSNAFKSDIFPTCEIEYEQAITYLQKEAICLSAESPRGFVLLSYKGVPLGFVKNVGNRANNLYPQEWRIRSKHLPQEVRVLF